MRQVPIYKVRYRLGIPIRNVSGGSIMTLSSVAHLSLFAIRNSSELGDTASHDYEVLGPTDFSNQWLEFWLALILGVELAHVPEVLRRETVATRELRLKVISERLYHGFSPAEYFLLLVNGLAKIPVERQ